MAKLHPIDLHVGLRLRQRRTLLGMSQATLGAAIGLTFQQIQKYERGSNRIAPSRLFELSRILDVPVSYFFDELPRAALLGRHGKNAVETAKPFARPTDPMVKRETLELVRAYYKIGDPRVRRNTFELVKSLGAADRAQATESSRKR